MTCSRLSGTMCALFCLTAVLFSGITSGQTVTGSISGTVKDSSGLVLAGTKVAVLNTDTGVNRDVQTDSAGYYSALLLPLGNYKVTASQPGFQTEARSGIELTIGREAVVDIALSVGSTQQILEVHTEAALINTSSSEIQGLVAGEQIRELPLNGRSYNDLALLNPGVIYNKMTGSSSSDGFGARMSVSGARTTYNLFLIDGTMINDTSQTAGTVNADSLGVEGIREFTVLTHNYSAEYGLRAGGVVNAVTRSGANQLHGSLYEFLRNSAVDARDFFQPGSIAPFRRNQFGGSIGGRIIKDKLFYFGNYEGFRQSLTQAQIGDVPDLNARKGFIPCTAASKNTPCVNGLANVGVSPLAAPYLQLFALPNGPEQGDGTAQWIYSFKQPIKEDFYLDRIDYHISDKDNFYFRDIFDPSTRVRPGGDPYWTSLDNATNYFAQVGDTHIFSGTAINDFRAAFNRTDRHTDIGPVNPAIASLLTPALSFVPGQPIGRLNFSGSNSGSAAAGGLEVLGNLSASPTFYIQNLFEEGDTFNLIRGKHSFKFGVDLQRIQTQYISGSAVRGSWLFGGLQGFLQAQPTNMDAGKVLGQTSLGTNSVEEFGWRQWIPSVFAVDDFRVNSRLTLNLGVRYEFSSDPKEVNGLSGTLLSVTAPASTIGIAPFQTTKKNFAPRIGFAWDPGGNGKTSVRGGFGSYFNEVNIKEAGIPADYQFSATYTLSCNWAGGANPCATYPYLPGNPPLSTAKSEVMAVSPLKTPTVLQYGLEIQHQFSNTTVLRVGYVGWKGYNMTRAENINDKAVDPATGRYNTAGAIKPNPAFGTITYLNDDAIANYNALQAEFKKSLSQGLQFQASYTYSKLLSDADSSANRVTDNTGDGYVSLVPNSPLADYGRGAYDQRQTFVVSGLYTLPFDGFVRSRLLKGAIGGWALGGIWQYGSGIPLNINDGFNNSGNGDPTLPDRPNVNPGFSNNPIQGTTSGCAGIPAGQRLQTPDRWFDPCAFSLPPAGTLLGPATVGKSTVNGPGTNQINMSLTKVFSLRERMKLQVRAEAFNLVNHPQFGVPSVFVFNSNGSYLGNAGQITITQGGGGLGGRNLQLGLKMTF